MESACLVSSWWVAYTDDGRLGFGIAADKMTEAEATLVAKRPVYLAVLEVGDREELRERMGFAKAGGTE